MRGFRPLSLSVGGKWALGAALAQMSSLQSVTLRNHALSMEMVQGWKEVMLHSSAAGALQQLPHLHCGWVNEPW